MKKAKPNLYTKLATFVVVFSDSPILLHKFSLFPRYWPFRGNFSGLSCLVNSRFLMTIFSWDSDNQQLLEKVLFLLFLYLRSFFLFIIFLKEQRIEWIRKHLGNNLAPFVFTGFTRKEFWKSLQLLLYTLKL